MSNDNYWMDFEEALQHIMRVTGKTRRQAKAALMKKLRAGEIYAIGTNAKTNRVERIPPKAWPEVH